jgi:hypothetical protein
MYHPTLLSCEIVDDSPLRNHIDFMFSKDSDMSGGEIFTAVPTADAAAQSSLLILREISNNLTALNARVLSVADKVDGLNDRVIRIEAREYGEKLESLETELHSCVRELKLEHETYKRERATLTELWEQRVRKMNEETSQIRQDLAGQRVINMVLSAIGVATLSVTGTLLAQTILHH